jgi:hypothetical protein
MKGILALEGALPQLRKAQLIDKVLRRPTKELVRSKSSNEELQICNCIHRANSLVAATLGELAECSRSCALCFIIYTSFWDWSVFDVPNLNCLAQTYQHELVAPADRPALPEFECQIAVDRECSSVCLRFSRSHLSRTPRSSSHLAGPLPGLQLYCVRGK